MGTNGDDGSTSPASPPCSAAIDSEFRAGRPAGDGFVVVPTVAPTSHMPFPARNPRGFPRLARD